MPRRHFAKWTLAEKRMLKELLAEGASTEEAAEELGRSWRAVQCQAMFLGIKRKLGPAADAAKRGRVLTMLGEGLSMRIIARALGRCHSTIDRMVQQMEKDGLVRRTGTVSRNVRYIPCSDEEILCQRRRRSSPCLDAS